MTRYIGLLQPIIVRRSGTHDEVVEAVARASVAAWLLDPDNPAWEPRLAGSFGKTVRRAKPNEVQKCREWILVTEAVGDAEAYACLPYPTDEIPAPIKRLQVSGLDMARDERPTVDHPAATEAPTLFINLGLDMTTGKTAAQAAHGLFGWVLRQTPARVAMWQDAGMPVALCSVDANEFTRVQEAYPGGVLIEDSGHTEIEPGSATVYAATL